MVKYWVIADMHLGHTKLVEEKFRPANFSDKILINLKRMVLPGHILIDLGDVCFEDKALWHSKLMELPGKKWLVLGNHDSNSVSWYLEHGYDAVMHNFTLCMFGKKILFSHKPKDITGYDLNLHGHFHSFGMDRVKETEPELFKLLTPKHRLMSLEESHYQPVSLEYLCRDRK